MRTNRFRMLLAGLFAAAVSTAGVLPAAASHCSPSPTVACVQKDQFQVEVTWSNDPATPLAPPDWPAGGVGRVGLQTRDTVFFYLVDPATPEILVKMLDGRPVNGHFWVFANATTDVGYTLTITDTTTGGVKRYVQEPGEVRGAIMDTSFHSASTAASAAPAAGGMPAAVPLAAAAPSPCGPTRLCLHDERFEVTVTWVTNFDGQSGPGQVIPYSDTTGIFWFFREENLEMWVTILDGRSWNGFFWVHVAGLTNEKVNVAILDRETGDRWSYTNPPRAPLGPVLDHRAFDGLSPITEVPGLGDAGRLLLVLLLVAAGLAALRRAG